MNEELKNKLLEILTAAQKAGADAYEYARRVAPELAREVVLWQVVDYAAGLVLGIASLALAAWLWRQIRRGWDDWRYDDVRVGLFPTLLALALLTGAFFTVNCGMGLARAKYAPRVFFIMACKDLLK